MTNVVTTLHDLKSPKGHFLLGHLKAFKQKNKHRILEEWVKECGELYTIKLGPKKVLVSANPEINTLILKQRPDKFRRLSKMNEVFVEMGFHTIFNAEGEQWKKQRKPVAEALSVKKTKSYYPIIHKKTENLLAKLKTYANTNATVTILNDFIAFTIDVTTEIAFGYQLDTLNNKENSFQNHLELIFPSINDRITASFPLWRILSTKKDKKLNASLKAIKHIIYDFIEDAKLRLEQDPKLRDNPSNFLEALLVESEKEDTVFDEQTLYSNIIAMLLAGEDTSSNTLSWTLFYLAQHPKIVKKIRAESNRVYTKHHTPNTYDEVTQLTYTTAAIQEAIRLKPTTPMLFLQANEDMVIHNLSIPKDTFTILQNSYATMQEPYFSNPQKYDPSRWIASECPYKKHSPKNIKAFGGGPRLCPGMHLSIIEMTTAISSICKHYDISLAVSPSDVEENFAFTVHPENLKVVFKHATN